MSEPTLGELIAKVMPRDAGVQKCPECGARLVVHVTLYSWVPVRGTALEDHGTIHYGDKLTETKAALEEQLADHYAGGRIDEREEIHCESCDWWCTPAELEMKLS
jgi:hypothetical protein